MTKKTCYIIRELDNYLNEFGIVDKDAETNPAREIARRKRTLAEEIPPIISKKANREVKHSRDLYFRDRKRFILRFRKAAKVNRVSDSVLYNSKYGR